MSAVALFVSSFLVLFLETALIRWMPAYVRLLAYFSNFILLASFLGIGVGCLLALRRRNLFVWFPLIQFAVILAVDRAAAGSRAAEHVDDLFLQRHDVAGRPGREHAAAAAALHVGRRAVRHRRAPHGRELSGRPPLRAYVINLLGQPDRRRGVRARLVAGAAAERLVRRRRRRGAAVRRAGSPVDRRGQRRAARRVARDRASHGGRQPLVAVLPHHDLPGQSRHRRRGEPHLSPVDGAGRAEGILLPVAVHRVRRHVRRGADPRRRHRHRRRRGAAARREARHRRRHRSGDPPAGRRAPSRQAVQRSARHRRQRRCAAFPEDDDEEVRPRGVRADRLADGAIELLRRAARELHVHEGVVRGGARAPVAARRDGALQLLPREVAGRSPGQHVAPRCSGATRSATCTRIARISR